MEKPADPEGTVINDVSGHGKITGAATDNSFFDANEYDDDVEDDDLSYEPYDRPERIAD